MESVIGVSKTLRSLHSKAYIDIPDTLGGWYGPATVECGCCFTECDADDTVACSAKHPFCIECFQRYSASQLGDHKPELVCMHSSGCKASFHSSTLKRTLTPKLFQLYERLIQQKELREANIENLEFCPRCDFAMIMEVAPEDEPLFRCLNVEEGCGKVTCRNCKRDNHLPRTCREEELSVMGPEHVVEEAMSEALMRRCPGCDRGTLSSLSRHLKPWFSLHYSYGERERMQPHRLP